ncbi:MAG: thioredoxin-disulfide reductase [Bacteroidetes bacterium SW_10_40_5]|nr:MAG: thioredoxin-disulfide reductase [Bacteroidetes bacterium SW_10_40_5]
MAENSNLEHVKLLIKGSGPAGYTAAIYAARAELSPVMYVGIEPGGQLMITTDVENYPGYPDGVLGPKMMEDFKNQAVRFDTDVRYGMVDAVDFTQRPFKIEVDEEKQMLAESVVISTGASAKWLGLESETKLNGHGVSACAVCDGFFFKGQDVVVVGGGDTAAEESLFLSKMCNKVTVLVRRDVMRASKIMQERMANTQNIEILFNHETKEIIGDQEVKSVEVVNNITNEEYVLDAQGFFVAIGHKPNTDIFKGQVEMDDKGYIITEPESTKTNIEGVFASGDVQDAFYRQAVTAAGTGCMAALDAERYLAEKELEMSKEASS